MKTLSRLPENLKIAYFKKTAFLILLPFLFAFQCEEEVENIDFASDYIIQNNSGTPIFLIRDNNNIEEIPAGDILYVSTDFNSVEGPVSPAETESINFIRLYIDNGGDLILFYEQEPLNNEAWVFSDIGNMRYEYRLIITDVDVNGSL
ncbi:hypothetical protein [Robertkochia sediminum]|uniref:hypothetical protein n=1 Tax=Robertkochia sediminum TaxID=2785326 RepID=UPI001931EE6F|nr:hypothetical protein [Robertkochia sediminum]MBL7474084.1 hypothetical protein [Robertkochia sediminum]